MDARPAPPRTSPPAAARRHGTLFLVVGPSGVGKDTLIDAARAALAADRRFAFARRAITREADAGGEAHEAITSAAFAAAAGAGAFAVSWSAHGLSYGIRHAALAPLAAGRNVVVNASRRAIPAFRAAAGRVVVLAVTAPPDVVRARLEARGREDAAEVAARLARDVPLAGVPDVAEVDNGGDVGTGQAAFLAALYAAANLPLALRRADVAGDAVALVSADNPVLAGGQVAAGATVEIAGEGRTVRARLDVASAGTLPPDALALAAAAFARLARPEGTEVEIRGVPTAPAPARR